MNENNILWQRISPIAIVIYFFKYSMFSSALTLLDLSPCSMRPRKKDETEMLFWIFVGIVGILALVLIYAALYYYNFMFSLTDEGVLLRKGVFGKEKLDLHYDRIQNIIVQHPFLLPPLQSSDSQYRLRRFDEE